MKKILWLLTAIAVMFGGQALVAPAANAAEITVTSTATSTASAKINSTTRVTINGAHQVSWQRPSKYKNIRLTKRNVQRAPVVRVDMSFTSAKLYRKSRGAKFVRVVGTWRNTGRYGNITAGFPTTARQPGMLMVFNSKTRKYEHGYTLKYPGAVKKTDIVKFYTSVKVAGKWRRVAVVVSCFNDFFGKVQKTFQNVVQVVLEGDVIEEAEVSAQADANAKATASGSCPDGTTVTAEASASASASAMAKIRYRIKYRLTSWNTKKAELITQVKASAEAKAKASAEAKISIECGENPPTYETPSVDVSPVACVEPGQTRDVTVTVSNPNGIADTAKVTYRGQVYTKSVAAHSQVTFTFANQAAGTYSGTALLVNANKSKSFTVTVEECPPPADNPPVVNIMGSPAHLYVGGNAYIWIEASDPDGDAVTVQVSASGAGTVAGLVPSDVRWDGTPCPSGKTCYRATAWAGDTPGNMTITAKVTANGKSATDSVTFPVKADEF